MIVIILESGHTITIDIDHSKVLLDGQIKRFIGKNHRELAIKYVMGER